MAFKIQNQNGYNEQIANDALKGQTLYIVGLNLDTQFEYVDDKRTNSITGYQVWIATDSHNPFKVKFSPEDKPDLTYFSIGDKITFEGLEAIQIRSNIYFRATGIQKS